MEEFNTTTRLGKMLKAVDAQIKLVASTLSERQSVLWVTRLKEFPSQGNNDSRGNESYAFETLTDILCHLQKVRECLYSLGIEREESIPTEEQGLRFETGGDFPRIVEEE